MINESESLEVCDLIEFAYDSPQRYAVILEICNGTNCVFAHIANKVILYTIHYLKFYGTKINSI